MGTSIEANTSGLQARTNRIDPVVGNDFQKKETPSFLEKGGFLSILPSLLNHSPQKSLRNLRKDLVQETSAQIQEEEKWKK